MYLMTKYIRHSLVRCGEEIGGTMRVAKALYNLLNVIVAGLAIYFGIVNPVVIIAIGVGYAVVFRIALSRI